jgi:hypothetical protein
MEKEYKQKRSTELRNYFTPLTATGSAFGAGAAYLVSFPIAAAYNLVNQVPTMTDGKITDGLGNALMYGFQTGGEIALAGGIAGLLITACARDWVQSLLGMKKR